MDASNSAQSIAIYQVPVTLPPSKHYTEAMSGARSMANTIAYARAHAGMPGILS